MSRLRVWKRVEREKEGRGGKSESNICLRNAKQGWEKKLSEGRAGRFGAERPLQAIRLLHTNSFVSPQHFAPQLGTMAI